MNKISPSKKNVNGKGIELKDKIFKWDYDASVKKMKQVVKNWQELSADLLRELYFAHSFLTTQKRVRHSPDDPAYVPFTWNDYCEAIGISRFAAGRMLKTFIPAELSDDGTDTVLTPEEVIERDRKKREIEAAQQEARIAEYYSTGLTPEGWTNADRREVLARDAEKKATALARKWALTDIKIKPKKDYFSEILEHSDDLKKFRLSTPEQNSLQLTLFDTIDTYLQAFPTSKDRLYAACNISSKLRELANYYMELEIQQLEQANSEGAEECH